MPLIKQTASNTEKARLWVIPVLTILVMGRLLSIAASSLDTAVSGIIQQNVECQRIHQIPYVSKQLAIEVYVHYHLYPACP